VVSFLGDILNEVVLRSVGCTEPAAIALATATAREAVGGTVEQLKVAVDPNTFKNAFAVTIPNTGGKAGIAITAALGALYGNPELKLEIFKDITIKNTKIAEQMVQQDEIQVSIRSDQLPLYIDATVKTSQGRGRAIIKGSHTNVVFVEVNGEVEVGDESKAIEPQELISDACGKLLLMKVPEIIHLTASLGPEETQFLLEGGRMNMTIAEEGLAERPGLAVGANIQDMVKTGLISDDVINEVKTLVAAAVDARMSGSSLPVMTSSQSGNQGIAITLPIVVVSRRMKSDQLEVARALALGHLFAAYTRLKVGELSTICGSGIASTIGAGVGILWLIDRREGFVEKAERIVKNVIGNISGILCGGANVTCALKLATTSGAAVEIAFLTNQSTGITAAKGIIADSAEETFNNLELISKSMRGTEQTILDIMTRNERVTMA